MQKFKFPFKNLSSQELDIEFSFMRTSAAFNTLDDQNRPRAFEEYQQASPFEFSVNPSILRVGSEAQAILNV